MNLKITAISDTHNHHEAFKLPGGDILIHSGDATSQGRLGETIKFLDWFGNQDYSYRIFVPGNHDWLFQLNPTLAEEECHKRGIILLNDSGVTVEGINIWGSPVQPEFGGWAFNRKRGSEIKKHWGLIPSDTELLVTHGPPAKILDLVPRGENAGCIDMLETILSIPSIKVHVFGHIHEGRGTLESEGRLFVNASSLDGSYKISNRESISIEKDTVSGLYSVMK